MVKDDAQGNRGRLDRRKVCRERKGNMSVKCLELAANLGEGTEVL